MSGQPYSRPFTPLAWMPAPRTTGATLSVMGNRAKVQKSAKALTSSAHRRAARPLFWNRAAL
eukprot:12368379-Alexandrium_andersonii.AAC.1